MDNLIITSGGAGDAMLGIHAGLLAKRNGHQVQVVACVRDEVFEPLNYLYSSEIDLFQHPEKEKWGNNNWILYNQAALSQYPHFNKYYVVPDLLHHHPLSLDFNKFGFTPHTLKAFRGLTHKYKPSKMIYMALNTSTAEYFYPFTPELIKSVAKELSDYQIYFNNISTWAGALIQNGDFSNLPDNVLYFENQSFTDSLRYLKQSAYCVCLDNGISHMAYSLGIPRLLISKRVGDLSGLLWTSRWYEDVNECISYNYSPGEIAETVLTNIVIPQTTLIPRIIVINNLTAEWPKILGFKF